MLTLTSALLGVAAPLDVAGPVRNILFASVPKFSPPPSSPVSPVSPSSPIASPPSPVALSCPADINAEIMKIYRGGQYDVCPPESFYYKCAASTCFV
eukprot:6173677-Pleurochrysis_carterae.AAC.2